MLAGIKKFVLGTAMGIMAIACISINHSHVATALESTNRNELYAPDEYNVSVSTNTGYTKLFENKNFEYYYSGEKTILKVKENSKIFINADDNGCLEFVKKINLNKHISFAIDNNAKLTVLGRLSDDVISGLGAFGDFSLNKLMIMLTGDENKYNIVPEDIDKLPQLASKNTKEFRQKAL